MLKTIKSFLRGKFGEIKTQTLNSMFLSNFYSINNLTIYTEYNGQQRTSQADHVLISKTSPDIFVIETKKYNALITGDVDDEFWQAQYGRHVTKQIKNPLRQNYGHIMAIKKLLETVLDKKLSLKDFHSVVYYAGNEELFITHKKQHEQQNKNSYSYTGHLFSKDNVVNDYKGFLFAVESKVDNRLLHQKDSTIKKEMQEQANEYKTILDESNLTTGFNIKSLINAHEHRQSVAARLNSKASSLSNNNSQMRI